MLYRIEWLTGRMLPAKAADQKAEAGADECRRKDAEQRPCLPGYFKGKRIAKRPITCQLQSGFRHFYRKCFQAFKGGLNRCQGGIYCMH